MARHILEFQSTKKYLLLARPKDELPCDWYLLKIFAIRNSLQHFDDIDFFFFQDFRLPKSRFHVLIMEMNWSDAKIKVYEYSIKHFILH